MKFRVPFLILVAVFFSPHWLLANPDLADITEFFVKYSGVDSSEYRAKIATQFNRKQTLRSVVKVTLLYGKIVGPHAMRATLSSSPYTMAAVTYDIQVARLALLDYLIGTEKLKELLLINKMLTRTNHLLFGNLVYTNGTLFNSEGNKVGTMLELLRRRIAEDPAADITMAIDQLLAEFGLIQKRGFSTTHGRRGTAVTVSEREVTEAIFEFLGVISSEPELPVANLASEFQAGCIPPVLMGRASIGDAHP